MVRESMESGQRFDLVFMDVQMPNLDGIQSTKRIREIGFSSPIVALTAFAEESNIKECYDSGMDFFLPKPIRRPELKKVLNKYFSTIHEEGGEHGGSAAPKMNDNRKGSNSAENNSSAKAQDRELPKKSPAMKETIADGAQNGTAQMS